MDMFNPKQPSHFGRGNTRNYADINRFLRVNPRSSASYFSWFLLAVAFLLASFAIVEKAYAQEGQPNEPTDDQVNTIAKKLYCPVCPNTPLDVCETKACQDWRAQIRDEIASGWSEPQIIDYFVAQYGERVLAEPQRSGFTSLVWVLPVLGVLLGLGVVSQVLKGWRSAQPARGRSEQAVEPGPPISEEARAQVEKALQELD